MGLEFTLRKIWEKTNEIVRKNNNLCLNKKYKSNHLYQNTFTITIILVDFYKCKYRILQFVHSGHNGKTVKLVYVFDGRLRTCM